MLRNRANICISIKLRAYFLVDNIHGGYTVATRNIYIPQPYHPAKHFLYQIHLYGIKFSRIKIQRAYLKQINQYVNAVMSGGVLHTTRASPKLYNSYHVHTDHHLQLPKTVTKSKVSFALYSGRQIRGKKKHVKMNDHAWKIRIGPRTSC